MIHNKKKWQRIKNNPILHALNNKFHREYNQQPERKIKRLDWYNENRNRISDKAKQYYKNNTEKVKSTNNIRYHNIRNNLISIIGGLEPKCSNKLCGQSNILYLEIDHIHNDGKRDLDIFKHRNVMYRYYIKNPDEAIAKLQILCRACNLTKPRK